MTLLIGAGTVRAADAPPTLIWYDTFKYDGITDYNFKIVAALAAASRPPLTVEKIPFPRAVAALRDNRRPVCVGFITREVAAAAAARVIAPMATWRVVVVSLSSARAPAPGPRAHVLATNGSFHQRVAQRFGYVVNAVSTPDDALRILAAGRERYWVEAEPVLRSLTATRGLQFDAHRTLQEAEGTLVCSSSTAQVWDAKLEAALNELRDDGTLAATR